VRVLGGEEQKVESSRLKSRVVWLYYLELSEESMRLVVLLRQILKLQRPSSRLNSGSATPGQTRMRLTPKSELACQLFVLLSSRSNTVGSDSSRPSSWATAWTRLEDIRHRSVALDLDHVMAGIDAGSADRDCPSVVLPEGELLPA
jgi:hypothetical protein